MKILTFSGSIRNASINTKLSKYVAKFLMESGYDANFLDLKDYPMPIYNGDIQESEGIPKSAIDFVEIIKSYDILLISTPEYNGFLSSLLKNVIDWSSRIDRSIYKDKVIGIMSASPGKNGGIRAIKNLTLLFEYLDANLLKNYISLPSAFNAFNDQGDLINEIDIQKIKEIIKEIKD